MHPAAAAPLQLEPRASSNDPSRAESKDAGEPRAAKPEDCATVKSFRVKMENDMVCRRKRLKCFHNQPIFRQSAKAHVMDLPEDVLGTILLKLPPKEIVRTCVLSSEWKHIWTACPKLRFDGATMFGESVSGAQYCSKRFADNVNAVLKQYHGKVVQEFEIQFEFDRTLAEHLDDWINFALSACAKNLALDLLPAKYGLRTDRYRFPFELFNEENGSRMQHMQLSYMSFDLPSKFSGFPYLKKLDLHVVRVAHKDLEDLLSKSFNLEWLSIVRCHLDDELKVIQPLPRLRYLHVAHCEITKIEFNAINLQTFAYSGHWLPIQLGHSLDLHDARLWFVEMITLDCALTALLKLLPRVQNLGLRSFMSIERPWLLENSSKFSQLKYLQLSFFVKSEDLNNIMSVASFLRAAPFVEKLDMHFTVCAFTDCSEVIRRIPGCTHNYLKNLCITGFAGCTGQVEFLVHIVESAPNLEVLTIDRANYFGNDEEYERRIRVKAMDIAKKHLDGSVSQNTKFSIM